MLSRGGAMPVPVVYADVVWLVNLVMDGALLLVTCWIAHRGVYPKRVLAAAFLGSLYALLMFIPPLSLFTTWAGKALMSLLMVWIGIPTRNWLDLLRHTALYYFVAFVFAGAAVAAHFALPGTSIAGGEVAANGRLTFAVSLQGLALIVAVPTAYGVLRFALSRMRTIRLRAAHLHHVHFRVGDRQADCIGLADTGNQLRDPLTRKPVCLLDAAVMASLVPDDLAGCLQSSGDWWQVIEALDDPAWIRRLSLIPFRGAGAVERMTFALRPDLVEVENGGVMRPSPCPCLLALHPGRLSARNEFQAILHIEVIAEDEGIEDANHRSISAHEVENPAAVALDSHSHQTGR